jgi:2-amino-4-hydroxy-6-hydroxymethyldihydropteridine diphosphokinase
MLNERVVAELSKVFIGLGSNIEPRLEYLQSAVSGLKKLGEIARVSAVYETLPVGGIPQPNYLNGVVELCTAAGPLELVRELKALEKTIGRKDRPRWHEREIDLDLLFYEDLILASQDVTIPHPEIPNRAFVLIPMRELAPELVHPVILRTMRDLCDEIKTADIKKTDFAIR